MVNKNTSTKYKILQSLRQSNSAVSGEKLAQENGISRTSVWKAVQSLQEAGYLIQNVA